MILPNGSHLVIHYKLVPLAERDLSSLSDVAPSLDNAQVENAPPTEACGFLSHFWNSLTLSSCRTLLHMLRNKDDIVDPLLYFKASAETLSTILIVRWTSSVFRFFLAFS
jgi:hypothetical protein